MAKFSDALGKWVAGTDRVCWNCKHPIKNLQRDLGEYRRVWPGGRTQVLCMSCLLARGKPEFESRRVVPATMGHATQQEPEP